MSDLTYNEVAAYLNVSPATIRNWIRQGILPPGPGIPEQSVKKFKKKLSGEESKRLKSRANKQSCRGTVFPSEYIPNLSVKSYLNHLAENPLFEKVSAETAVFSYFHSLMDCLPKDVNPLIKKEMLIWEKEQESPGFEKLVSFFKGLSLPKLPDPAGLFYQLLQREGRKSTQGSYYTPPQLAEEIITSYKGLWQHFLDPCCGSGIFLLTAARLKGDPHSVTGWDTDKTAVHIARMNLMLQFPRIFFDPDIEVKSALTENENRRFELIATNPPWGHHFSKEEREKLKKLYPKIRSGESFSYFLELGMSLLSKDGNLSFLVPEALLNVKTHKDIRQQILAKSHITSAVYQGKVFSRVQTPVVRLDLSFKKENYEIAVLRGNHIYSINPDRFSMNPHYLFDFNCTDRDQKIVEIMFAHSHKTLYKRAEWILGVVSGDNNRFISNNPQKNQKPIISGHDISPMYLAEPSRFILFNRRALQQSAPLEKYNRKNKIVYRFISGKPVFAIDRIGYVTLNSANSFIPHKEFSIEVITALFNSSLYHFLLKKKFNSIKILRNHLEYLPIPQMTPTIESYFRGLVMLGEKKDQKNREKILEKIDNKVFNLFEIEHSDRKYILEQNR